MERHLCVGIDVGCKAHRVAIARPDGSILDEFDILHSNAGFQELFRCVEQDKEKVSLPGPAARSRVFILGVLPGLTGQQYRKPSSDENLCS